MLKLISLGWWCQTALNIHRHYSQQSQFFDWTQQSTASIIRLLRTDFQDVFLKENLVITEKKFDNRVIDRNTGVNFHHAFTRDSRHLSVNQDTIDAEYESAKAKVDRLINRWRELKHTPDQLVFVRLAKTIDSNILELADALNTYFDRYIVLIYIEPYTTGEPTVIADCNKFKIVRLHIPNYKFSYYEIGNNQIEWNTVIEYIQQQAPLLLLTKTQ
jgi:hypothetical protein